MSQILIPFLVGGAVVSAFAIIGDLLKPKSFAGLFGAAPSRGFLDGAMLFLFVMAIASSAIGWAKAQRA